MGCNYYLRLASLTHLTERLELYKLLKLTLSSFRQPYSGTSSSYHIVWYLSGNCSNDEPWKWLLNPMLFFRDPELVSLQFAVCGDDSHKIYSRRWNLRLGGRMQVQQRRMFAGVRWYVWQLLLYLSWRLSTVADYLHLSRWVESVAVFAKRSLYV